MIESDVDAVYIPCRSALTPNGHLQRSPQQRPLREGDRLERGRSTRARRRRQREQSGPDGSLPLPLPPPLRPHRRVPCLGRDRHATARGSALLCPAHTGRRHPTRLCNRRGRAHGSRLLLRALAPARDRPEPIVRAARAGRPARGRCRDGRGARIPVPAGRGAAHRPRLLLHESGRTHGRGAGHRGGGAWRCAIR